MIDRGRVRRLLVDVVPSVVLSFAAGHELLYNHAPAWQWATATALVWVLVLRRRFPVPVLGITLALVLVAWLQDVLLAAHLGVLVALHAVAWRRARPYAVAAGLVVEAGAVLVAIRFAPTGSVNDGVVLLSGLVMTALLLGTTQRAQQSLVGTLVDRADQLERERNHRALMAAAEERARIAREIHDIVAHSVSVMVALSEGAARTPDADESRATMRQVAATGREALSELRRVLSVLHSPDSDSDGDPAADADSDDRAPQPLLGALPSLLRDVELAGLPVDLSVTGDVGELPQALQATAYRIVQESLTNTLKHAVRASRVEVRIRADETLVRVEVSDDGVPVSRAGTGRGGSSGNGIRGMTERAHLYDGSVSAGPTTGGWQVTCVLHRERAPA